MLNETKSRLSHIIRGILSGRKFSLVLGFMLSLLVLLFTVSSLFAQTATAPLLGDGSSGNPYQIANLENLYWIAASDAIVPSPTQATRWAAYYIQTADFDASDTETWFPDGSGGYYGWAAHWR